MVQMLASVVAWLWKLNGIKAIQSDELHGLRLLADATLVSTERPYETCSAEYLKRFCDTSGFEPATRTLVHSNLAGHSVQVLLLKNRGQLHA